MSVLVWIHEDSLSPRDPALLAHPDAPAVFVWDDERTEAEGYSLKRILFQYECLLEIPVAIHRGPTVSRLLALAEAHGSTRVVATDSVQPRFKETVRALERTLPIELLPTDEFVPATLEADLRRFSRFWRRAEPYAFRRTGR